jgi:hypothetical protein
MEHQLWKKIVLLLKVVDKPRPRGVEQFTCVDIVRVLFWAVLHDRPISWATQRKNWPIQHARHPLPSNSTMSRRLRSADVHAFLEALQRAACQTADAKTVFWVIDAKALVINGPTRDRQTGVGRASRGIARGYKLHLIQGTNGFVAAWRIAPLNKDERVMARRMVRTADIQGYLVADGNYDSNALHEVCRERGNLQLVAPLRGGSRCHHRRSRKTAGRQRAQEILENPNRGFSRGLMKSRKTVERTFANLTNWGGGLTHLPPWIRTHRRVRRWVQTKLILNSLRRSQSTTYVDR